MRSSRQQGDAGLPLLACSQLHHCPNPPPRAPCCTCLQGLANIVWGLGKMGVRVTHEIRQMVEALSREMVAQLTDSRHMGARARTPPRAAHACPVIWGRPVWAALLLTGCSAVYL